MIDTNKKNVYVIYTYTPEHPYYFDQTDVTEINTNVVKPETFEKEVKTFIADKKFCSPLEVNIQGVFSTKNDLVNYLKKNQLSYLL